MENEDTFCEDGRLADILLESHDGSTVAASRGTRATVEYATNSEEPSTATVLRMLVTLKQKNQEAEERKDTTQKKEREEDLERHINFKDMPKKYWRVRRPGKKYWRKKERRERNHSSFEKFPQNIYCFPSTNTASKIFKVIG